MSAVRQLIETARTTVRLPFEFDWKAPDYQRVFHHRALWLADLRENPEKLQQLLTWYPGNVAQFICDWGCTFDPRNPERGLPSLVPFILFPKQIEWIDWFLDCWHGSEPGITEKSRDCGVSWLAMCVTSSLCLFRRGLSFGFGSAVKIKVDRSDDPDCLFYKARFFLNHLPSEFRGGWRQDRDSADMRITYRQTGSTQTGESGDDIGRGGRKSAYFVDEAAHLQHPQMVESSLLSNTNCRIDVSSVKGMANPFAIKRHGGKIKVFSFHWRDDPRKGEEWYEAIKRGSDPVSIAQDVDMNYAASVEGVLIPSAWFQAAVGALERLRIEPSGVRRGGFDVADEGKDKNAFAGRHGQELQYLDRWSGRGGDIYRSVERVVGHCHAGEYDSFVYDADGLGAGVRGDARMVNAARKQQGLSPIHDYPFQGSGTVSDPEAEFKMGHGDIKSVTTKRKNKDMFANLKAQSWWALRMRFQATYRAVVERLPYNGYDLISIAPDVDYLPELALQMQQPTYSRTGTGKFIVDKSPDGASSPDLADAVMIAFNPEKYALETWLGLGAA